MAGDMTRAEAEAEARRRWGPTAAAQENDTHYDAQGLATRCRVCRHLHFGAVADGVGPTWEAAFADADRRAAGGKAP